jgi:hypothetical protein
MNRNNSGNKLNNKSIITKKSKIKSRLKSKENINGNNEALFKKEKKIFQSSIVTEFKPIKDDLNENSNINYGANLMNAEVAKSVGKYKKKIKNLQIATDKNFSNNENIINENNNNNDSNAKKKLTINPDYVQETYKFKNKSKSRIKDKENTGNDNKKLLNKKRRRKKRRKVTISLSTPENKKTQISRMMPKRKYFFGIPVENRHRKKNSRKNKLCPEDFNPIINNVEIVREGLEIHSKSIILINKSLLTEKLFPENNYQYKPNLNLTIPVSPRVQQFPSVIPKTMKNGEENNYFHNFNERNISIGLPTPMDGFYEPQLSPVAITNLMMYGPPSTQNIYKLDFRYENSFLRNNLQNSYTPKGYINPSILTPNTPKREINLQNKIVIQNNSNISCNDNTDGNYLQEKCKKPAELNMEFIENYNNENSNNPYPTYPIFGGNDNIGSSLAKQTMNSPANIFNLSPTSPFMPKPPYGDKAL